MAAQQLGQVVARHPQELPLLLRRLHLLLRDDGYDTRAAAAEATGAVAAASPQVVKKREGERRGVELRVQSFLQTEIETKIETEIETENETEAERDIHDI
jgi:hypothetical protein